MGVKYCNMMYYKGAECHGTDNRGTDCREPDLNCKRAACMVWYQIAARWKARGSKAKLMKAYW